MSAIARYSKGRNRPVHEVRPAIPHFYRASRHTSQSASHVAPPPSRYVSRSTVSAPGHAAASHVALPPPMPDEVEVEVEVEENEEDARQAQEEREKRRDEKIQSLVDQTVKYVTDVLSIKDQEISHLKERLEKLEKENAQFKKTFQDLYNTQENLLKQIKQFAKQPLSVEDSDEDEITL